VSSNSASQKGGAIYARGDGVGFGRSLVCAFDYRIDDNTAPDGAAVYEDWETSDLGDIGSDLYLNGSFNCGPESPPALGSVPCAHGVACNEFFGNITENASAQLTDGAVIAVGSSSYIVADRLIMRENTAGYAVNIIGQPGGTQLTLEDCLLADNHTEHELMSMQRSARDTLVVDGCTLANNRIDSGDVLNINGNVDLSLFDSIFDMPGVPTVAAAAGATLTAMSLLSNDTSTLPVDASIVQGEPTFVNPGADYHLQPTSLGVDFAPVGGGYDLDRVPRDVDLIQVPNYQGPRDIGAYERQSAFDGCGAGDTIFCSGFEP
jgi:predicted outer membrane repeat protein